jgi:hypothetical protein
MLAVLTRAYRYSHQRAIAFDALVPAPSESRGRKGGDCDRHIPGYHLESMEMMSPPAAGACGSAPDHALG